MDGKGLTQCRARHGSAVEADIRKRDELFVDPQEKLHSGQLKNKKDKQATFLATSTVGAPVEN